MAQYQYVWHEEKREKERIEKKTGERVDKARKCILNKIEREEETVGYISNARQKTVLLQFTPYYSKCIVYSALHVCTVPISIEFCRIFGLYHNTLNKLYQQVKPPSCYADMGFPNSL